MGSFEPSVYQKDILNHIANKNGNLLINAKAGSGKTSTLIMISDEILKQNKKCLFLAFNKSIVEELNARIISDDCQVMTIHSVGNKFLRSQLYRKHNKNYELVVDTSYGKEIVEKFFVEQCGDDFKIANQDLGPEDLKSLYHSVIREITELTQKCRLYNVDYRERYPIMQLMYDHCHDLRDYDEIGCNNFPEVVRLTIEEIKNRFNNPPLNDKGIPVYTVDYTDMIYFPTLYQFKVPFVLKDYLDYILVDECQDLSVLQQKFLNLLKGYNTRYIFVGDEKQSIYGFAGADTKSIKNLKKNFFLDELPLDICYRCPEKVIKLAKDIVPSIDWNHTRTDAGIVEFLGKDEIKDLIQPGDVIVGRRNKDLVKIYKELAFDHNTQVKFKNTELVNKIVNEIERVIKTYIKYYNKYENIDKELHELLKAENFDMNKPQMTDEDNKYIVKKAKELINEHKKTDKKPISKSNQNLEYLQICMGEYKAQGSYDYIREGQEDFVLKEYFGIISELIEQYRSQGSISVTIKSFIEYVKEYLSCNMTKNVPIISSIHQMKGGEADTVFILDYPKFPYIYSNQNEDDQQQEQNLQYVALTRAKKNLYLCLVDNPDLDEKIEEQNDNSRRQVTELLARTYN